MRGETQMKERETNHSDDTIVLTIPTGRSYRGVATLVLGGVGSRLDLPYERMDDLQLAVLSMLDASEGEEASVEIRAQERRVGVSVGPLRADAPTDEGLARVLRRLSDEIAADRRDGLAWLTVYVERRGADGEAVVSSPSA